MEATISEISKRFNSTFPEFIQDDDRLRDERKKAKKNKDKYVGMSNDSLGFKAGRSAGWQTDKWPSGSGGSGNGGTGGGFRDHSDDEDTNRRTPPEDEFRDDDFDSGFGKKATSPVSGGGSSAFRDSAITEPKSATVSASIAKPVSGPRVKKPINLGAAAAFAAQPKQQPSASETPQHNYNPIVADLFAADDVVPSHVASNLSFDDADDFDPRDSAHANGSFGDFSAAFTSGEQKLPAKIESQDDGDDFADFSSAFGGGSHTAAPSIPAAFSPTPAAASTAPMFDLFSDAPVATAEKVSTVDLLSGLDMGGGGFGGPMSSAPASNFGGLGGLNFSPPPPLIGAHSMLPSGGALQPQPNSGSLFDFDMQAPMGGPQLQPSNNNNVNMSNAATSASNNFNKKPTTWDTVAGVNIDLDNLKLGGKSQKKPALPMNALLTPTSSPTKGFPNRPPQMMKPGGALSSNDLL